jgi:hypothetical protein
MSVIIAALTLGALSARGDVYEVSFQGRFTSSNYPTAAPLNSTFTVNVILDYSAVSIRSDFGDVLMARFPDFIRSGSVKFGSQDFDHHTTYYDIGPGPNIQVGTANSSGSFFFKISFPGPPEGPGYVGLDGQPLESASVDFHIGTGFEFDPVSGNTMADHLGASGGTLPSFLGRSFQVSSFAPGGGFYQAMGGISSYEVTLIESSIPEPSSSGFILGICSMGVILLHGCRRKARA